MKTSIALLLAALFFPLGASAAIYVKIPGMGVQGLNAPPPYNNGEWFQIDAFGVKVTRQNSDSAKNGTTDLNIGVGELQECTISKSMDSASARLAQFAINGNSCGTAEIDFVEVGGGGTEGQPIAYLRYKLDRCFVKSWSTSGDADDRPTEEVAFYYNKIAFQYAHTSDGVTYQDGGTMGWDATLNREWTDHGIPKDPAARD